MLHKIRIRSVMKTTLTNVHKSVYLCGFYTTCGKYSKMASMNTVHITVQWY